MVGLPNRQPLYVAIAEAIQKRIAQGEYLVGSRLPSEPELAADFSVSRGTLREAMSVLEKGGQIIRRHGVGSFVGQPAKVVAGMEKLESLTATIRRAGFIAEDRILKIDATTVTGDVAEKLQVPEGSRAYRIESLRLADGIPVIYCYDLLPEWLIPSIDELRHRRETESMEEYLGQIVNTQPFHYISDVTAVIDESDVTKLLQVSKKTPLIKMEGVMFDQTGRPLNYGRQYFRSDKYQFTLVRR